ncbi:hypothetical protein M438DRAFT_361777 [Aureobasidium pullulans EXF-150]|uniref:Uncharacterized protein n=1 Tax=Aureobasidium pullulans EXF-150 TaxID=1043002 RepID=A0A074XS54_AURPU|nr:uncharacterized protein M438DRAFT_361777 [Aureobasidium pullulans EXF-150]KEQ88438.1 hypothetical protein M438DRAFT_361777 [Aureobasidium pullulans EXF-150]
MRSSLVSSHLSRNHSLCSVERSHTLRSCHCVASLIKYIVPIISASIKHPLTQYSISNPFETQGTKNIGARWSAGGGSDVHTPGAATPRGNAENTTENQDNASGIRSEHFQEHQISQRPGEPGPFDKAWNKAHYGTEKGK